MPKISSIFLMAFAGAAAVTAMARIKKQQQHAKKRGGHIASHTWASTPYAQGANPRAAFGVGSSER